MKPKLRRVFGLAVAILVFTMSMQVSAATDGQLLLGAADGPSLNLLPLPYPLLDDI